MHGIQDEASNGSGEQLTGTVKWFNDQKGYGFIAVNGSKDDIFVHYSSIRSQGFRSLKEGASVQFTRVQTAKGYQANDVMVLD